MKSAKRDRLYPPWPGPSWPEKQGRTGGREGSKEGRRKGRKSQCGGLRSVVSLDRPSSEIMRKNGSAVPESSNGEGIEAQKMLLGDRRSQMSLRKNMHDSSRRSRHRSCSLCHSPLDLLWNSCKRPVPMTKLYDERSLWYWLETVAGGRIFGNSVVNQSYITHNCKMKK